MSRSQPKHQIVSGRDWKGRPKIGDDGQRESLCAWIFTSKRRRPDIMNLFLVGVMAIGCL